MGFHPWKPFIKGIVNWNSAHQKHNMKHAGPNRQPGFLKPAEKTPPKTYQRKINAEMLKRIRNLKRDFRINLKSILKSNKQGPVQAVLLSEAKSVLSVSLRSKEKGEFQSALHKLRLLWHEEWKTIESGIVEEWQNWKRMSDGDKKDKHIVERSSEVKENDVELKFEFKGNTVLINDRKTEDNLKKINNSVKKELPMKPTQEAMITEADTDWSQTTRVPGPFTTRVPVDKDGEVKVSFKKKKINKVPLKKDREVPED